MKLMAPPLVVLLSRMQGSIGSIPKKFELPNRRENGGKRRKMGRNGEKTGGNRGKRGETARGVGWGGKLHGGGEVNCMGGGGGAGGNHGRALAGTSAKALPVPAGSWEAVPALDKW